MNPILLSLHAEKHQLTSKWYGTFNQWRQLDGRVMRRPPHVPEGQWGCQICFWTPVTKTVHTDEGDEERTVFSSSACTRCSASIRSKASTWTTCGPVRLTPVSPSPSITSPPRMPSRRLVRPSATVGARRFIAHPRTTSRCRPKATFETLDEFYGTCFHELCHWTEHPSRLNWSRKEKENTYALGELVAEIGSCFLCRELGVPASENLENHIAYVGELAPGDAERSSLHLHGIGTSQQSG